MSESSLPPPSPPPPITLLATASWHGGLTGHGAVQSAGELLPVVVPKELGGAGDAQSPESLLASAAASCYAVTLALVLAGRGLAVASLEVEAALDMAHVGRGVTITGLTLRPRVKLAGGAEVPAELYARAERACPVSRVIAGGIPLTVAPA